jgi:hypothetical protein
MQKNIYFLILFFIFFSSSTHVFGWFNHTHGTYLALEELDFIKNAKPVKVEKLEAFLKKEREGLKKLLDEQEVFLRENSVYYPNRPEALVFNPPDNFSLKEHFLKALRFNPQTKLAYYIQELPGTKVAEKDKFPLMDVSVFKDDKWISLYVLSSLKENQEVKPIAVLATASDEPDYGHDIGLYEDSETEHGKLYNFGVQPFGDPKLEYSSQAPFHMGFFHEAPIIYAAADFLKQTHPEYRIYQCYTLAKFAFETGHPYWGYRFAGWALHYLQDLTQPYHARVLPNYGVTRMISINLFAMLGMDGSKNEAIQRASDRHAAIEHYQYISLYTFLKEKDLSHPMLHSYKKNSFDGTYPVFSYYYARQAITLEAHNRSDTLDTYIDNWKPILNMTDINYPIKDLERDSHSEVMDAYFFELLGSFGAHTRNFVEFIIPK